MLELTVDGQEYFNEVTMQFVSSGPSHPVTLKLEHSLLSLSNWESKWKKSFLKNIDKLTDEEFLDYVRCMTINKGVDASIYDSITPSQLIEVKMYMNDTMTATTFSKNPNENKKPSREVITSELIYYWMVVNEIPFECEKWHLNRLLTLIRVCEIKQQPQKKMSKRDVMAQNRALNKQRRRK